MQNEKCAPGKKFSDGSCFTLESLKLIASKYNSTNKNKIEITDNKKKLVKDLTNAFSKSCSTQSWWLRLDIAKSLDEDTLENTFRPEGPQGKFDWLSTLDINNVLTQTAASSTASASSSAGIRFMRRWDLGDYWGGYLAIVRIYNRALSATEINTNYQVSKARFGLS
jgi:hypothetical protein